MPVLCIALVAGVSSCAAPGRAPREAGKCIRTVLLIRHGAYDEGHPKDNERERLLIPMGREQARLTGRRYGLVSAYRADDAQTVFVSLGSAAENVEAAVDYLRNRGEKVGSIHVNVLRPFPEAALVAALKGPARVIVLERTDQPLAGDNPLARDIRTALTKVLGATDQLPRIFSGVYGLGSRDFRPEGVLGAYAFATGTIARQDGRTAADGANFFVVGVDHPYEVKAAEH